MAANPQLPTVHTGEGGRPAYSDAVRKAICDNLKLGQSRTGAANAAGVSRDTFYEWMKSDPAFFDAVTLAEGAAERFYVGRLARSARGGSVQAQTFWLERRRPRDWREKVQLDVMPTDEDELADLGEAELDARSVALLERAIARREARAGADTASKAPRSRSKRSR